MPKRLIRLIGLFVWLAALVVGLLLALDSPRSIGGLATWVGAVAVADLIRVPSPSGGRISLIGGAGLVGVVLIDSIPTLAAVFLLGLALSRLVTVLWADESRASDLLRTLAGLSALLLVEVADSWLAELNWDAQWEQLGVILFSGLAWFIADAVVRMLGASGLGGASIRYVWLLTLEDWPIMVSLFASAGLFALAQPIISWWAIPLALVPYAISHVSFTLLAGTRQTYGQMIRALSKLPEVAGLSPEGHAAGTAMLAATMARGMGMHPDDVTQLEYAALLHDIGRITQEDPTDEPASSDLARWGAEIIRQAPYLSRVADYVEHHEAPYRRPGEAHDDGIGIEARIIKVAGAYDRAHRTHDLEPVEALEVLHRRTAYDYDPEIVARLRAVLRRSGRLAA
ncbi:MAG: HD domain-containing protein [Acidimicrobiia bacterium]|nr:HD domain-containing protein [Acidimicrobiia bacterium]